MKSLYLLPFLLILNFPLSFILNAKLKSNSLPCSLKAIEVSSLQTLGGLQSIVFNVLVILLEQVFIQPLSRLLDRWILFCPTYYLNQLKRLSFPILAPSMLRSFTAQRLSLLFTSNTRTFKKNITLSFLIKRKHYKHQLCFSFIRISNWVTLNCMSNRSSFKNSLVIT